MKLLQRIGRKVASKIAARVARDELFERHGERPRQEPLRAAPSPTPAQAEPTPEAPSGLTGCVPMDADEVKALLGPSDRIRVVNHWATWCDPCIEELPLLVDLHRRLGERVAVVGVSWDLFEGGQILPTAMKVAAFAEGQKLTWGSALVTTPPEPFFAALDIDWRRIPQTWILAPDGAILRRIEGVIDEETADALVAELSS